MKSKSLCILVLLSILLGITSNLFACSDPPEAVIESIVLATGGTNYYLQPDVNGDIYAVVYSDTADDNISLDGSSSFDAPPGSPLTYAWDINDDGYSSGNGSTLNGWQPTEGVYTIKLKVTSTYSGLSDIATVRIIVGPRRVERAISGTTKTVWYSYIQHAIDQAGNGDEITANEGIYVENIDFKGKNITVQSTNPSNPDVVANTVIVGNGIDPTVSFTGTEPDTCKLEGFTLKTGLPDPTLIAHWKLDESTGYAEDSGIGGIDGTRKGINGLPVWQPSGGKIGGALLFDGIDDYVEVANISNLFDDTFSVFCWIQGGGSSQGIISQKDDVGAPVWINSNWNGALVSQIDDSTGALVSTYTGHTDGNWHHVGFVWDGERRHLYADGVEIKSDENPIGDLVSSTNNILIGAQKADSAHWSGLIDDVRIYKRDLDAIEVERLFLIDAPGPVAHWTFDETSGNANDIAGPTYEDGILQGTAGLPQWQPNGGQIDGALLFEEDDDHVEVDGVTGVFGAQSRTVSAWIKTTDVAGRIISWGTESPGKKWIVRVMDSGSSLGVLRTEIGTGYIYGATKINDYKWHHIAVVYDSRISEDIKDVQLFVDGVLESGCTFNSYDIDTSDGTKVGIGEFILPSSPLPYSGLIDDVRIYDRPLNTYEIDEIHSDGKLALNGGGIYGNSGNNPDGTLATISKCVITGNKAKNGGGIYDCDGKISSCKITGNKATANGGGLVNCDGKVINCLIAGNSAKNAGGLDNCDGDIINCTVVHNSAIFTGGGLNNCDGSNKNIANNIIWGNTGEQITNYGSVTITNNCIAWPFIAGNIYDNPLFVDIDGADNNTATVGDNNYHLASNSPCVDTGDNSFVDFDYDIEQNDRKQYTVLVFEGGNVGAPVVDMGVYEVDGVTGTIWYVDADASGAEDGSSDNPYDTIQEGITAAAAGDVVLVAKGTYSGAGNRDLDFDGKAITVQSTNPNDWEIVAATVIDCGGSEAEPHRGFYFNNSEGNDSVVSGLTITGGWGNEETTFPDSPSGGGVLCEGSSPSISNCLIKNNQCKTGTNYSCGGGLACYSSSFPIIKKCIIINNTADAGGGILADISSSVKVIDSIIAGNTAKIIAGIAIYGPGAKVTNCTIFNNDTTASAPTAGVLLFNDGTVINSILWANTNNGVTDKSSQIYLGSNASSSYCCIYGWGASGGLCFEENPNFKDTGNLIGLDSIWGTSDDGLQLTKDSSCIDAANGDEAGASDVTNMSRIDIVGYSGAVGNPGYADLGAYEFSSGPYNSRAMEMYTTIQEAIDSSTTIAGDIIILPEGIYSGLGNRDLDFKGKAITVQSTNPNDWKVVANTVIQSGGTNADPHRGFHFQSNEGNDSVISGLTITGGCGGPGQYVSNPSGGGVLCEYSSPTISNCLIKDNTCKSDSPDNSYGGGIACYFGSIPIVTNCIITENSDVYMGGGIYGDANSSGLKIINSVVAKNTAANTAGICIYAGGAEITNCTIFDNDSTSLTSYSAGVLLLGGIVTNSILWDNSKNGADDMSAQVFVTVQLNNSCVEGSNTSTWGNDLLGDNPNFRDVTDLDGSDDIWGTYDDGLQLLTGSHCIDTADGDKAPVTDIVNSARFDVTYIDDKETGGITYADIGAYESYDDTDCDGLPDSWEKQYWPTDDLSMHDSLTDSDGDGILDRFEYLFGYDPKVYTSSPSTTLLGHQEGGNIYAPFTPGSVRQIKTSYMLPSTPVSENCISFDFCLNKDCDIDVSIKRTDKSWSEVVRTIPIHDSGQGVKTGELCTVTWDGTDNSGKLVESYFYDVKIEEVSNPVALWTSDPGVNSEPSSVQNGYVTDGFDVYRNSPAVITSEVSDYGKQLIRITDESGTVKIICNNKMLMPGINVNTRYWYGYDSDGKLYYDSGGLNFAGVVFDAPVTVRKGALFVKRNPFFTSLQCDPYRIVSSNDEITTISYYLAYDSNITVKVYDSEGELFATLLTSTLQNFGLQSIEWNGQNDAGECISSDGPCRIVIEADGMDEMIEGTITVYK